VDGVIFEQLHNPATICADAAAVKGYRINRPEGEYFFYRGGDKCVGKEPDFIFMERSLFDFEFFAGKFENHLAGYAGQRPAAWGSNQPVANKAKEIRRCSLLHKAVSVDIDSFNGVLISRFRLAEYCRYVIYRLGPGK
jgi:hypothetical protein